MQNHKLQNTLFIYDTLTMMDVCACVCVCALPNANTNMTHIAHQWEHRTVQSTLLELLLFVVDT